MPTKTVSAKALTAKLRGQTVSHVVTEGFYRMALHFSDGTALELNAEVEGLIASIGKSSDSASSSGQPTKRQREYLVFIEKYIARFDQAPAESDIGKHFLVSAPSVNQMMQSLERRKFITRQPGVARSIKLVALVPLANVVVPTQ
jgi:LexA DNA binding domain